MWNLYNILSRNDIVKGTVVRKVSKESYTGLTSSTKKKMEASIRIKSIQYDGEDELVRINGTNVSESKFIKIGQHQAMDIFPPRRITLIKKQFDGLHIMRLIEATNEDATAKLAVCVMEEGIAHLFLISNKSAKLKAKIEKSIPKNKKFNKANYKAKSKFYSAILNAIESKLNLQALGLLIIGSPGFTKDGFMKYVNEELPKRKTQDLKNFFEESVITVHCKSGFKHSVHEILEDQSIQDRIKHHACSLENQILDKFFETMNLDPNRCCYGFKSVEYAFEQGAIEHLLISDKMYRSFDPVVRDKYVNLIFRCKKKGCQITHFSSQLLSGERLDDMTGIAAILSYSLPELDELDDDDQDDSYEEDNNEEDKKEEQNEGEDAQQEDAIGEGDEDFYNNLVEGIEDINNEGEESVEIREEDYFEYDFI